ncbi:hypothetical protein EJ05DRAFT_142023 [Pseudovirgaria hyperparasitica]|uniref:Uncharacterized protein n=1 Tax=Pseudovirgaria hyperparasitica TaxID=470096 RepID=A0A6A6VXT6_9PEZI|nr:uncharacterized protein EJ05DRAFT_142023 [Pseudovirgaria hyperparasitica]KAF2754450.1 hypothetical protein EJ05DRAFT_142023 [Pseudovirgaria hyperparasitica]
MVRMGDGGDGATNSRTYGRTDIASPLLYIHSITPDDEESQRAIHPAIHPSIHPSPDRGRIRQAAVASHARTTHAHMHATSLYRSLDTCVSSACPISPLLHSPSLLHSAPSAQRPCPQSPRGLSCGLGVTGSLLACQRGEKGEGGKRMMLYVFCYS